MEKVWSRRTIGIKVWDILKIKAQLATKSPATPNRHWLHSGSQNTLLNLSFSTLPTTNSAYSPIHSTHPCPPPTHPSHNMAFVSSLPVTARPAPLATRTSLTGASVSAATASSAGAVRMGYGDYSYANDKTKGHVGQYYVDKFRVASDFSRGAPATLADAPLGRNIKGGKLVPIEGIPQQMDAALPPFDPNVAPDPRIAEAEGAVYPWDVNYVDPQFAADTYADLDDDELSATALAEFRASMISSRTAALSAMDFGAVARVNRIKGGMDERYLLTLDGALDVRYAKAQKVASPMTFTPTGQPQTEIPGIPYLGSVGALDFKSKPGDSVAFWGSQEVKDRPYKKPSGASTPDLPYNTSASLEEMQSAQEARGLLPSSE